MSKLFGSVNEVDPHKKLRQSNLALEKYGLSQCGWIWLFMEVDMVMNIEKICKLFHYGIRIWHHDKYIGIR